MLCLYENNFLYVASPLTFEIYYNGYPCNFRVNDIKHTNDVLITCQFGKKLYWLSLCENLVKHLHGMEQFVGEVCGEGMSVEVKKWGNSGSLVHNPLPHILLMLFGPTRLNKLQSFSNPPMHKVIGGVKVKNKTT